MRELLSKRLEDIDVSDILGLFSTQAEEGVSLEFKGTLPVDQGQTEPWQSGKDRISRISRDKILSEVVAMANAGGVR